MAETSNMKKNVVWNVRDARGLSVYEKAFLFVVASRGTVKCYRKTLMEDMGGISTGQLSKVVNSLLEKDLIEVHPGYWVDGKKTQTMYSIKEDVLATFVPAREEGSQNEQGGSPHELVRSPHELPRSPHGGYKETKKETKKETIKETKDMAPAGAVAIDTSPKSKVDTTSSLNSKGDKSPSNSSLKGTTSPNSEKGIPPLPKGMGAVRANSKRMLDERRAAKQAEKDAGRDWLEHLIKKERLDEQDADRARGLYDDTQWRPDARGTQRAAVSVFSSKPVPAGPVQEEVSTKEEW
jgi:hypothetical protein